LSLRQPAAETAGRVRYEQVKRCFDQQGIEIPFPYRNALIRRSPADAHPATV
jgi:hypothetical protein